MDFDEYLKKRIAASDDFVNGDAASLLSVSTETDPASLFGPMGGSVNGAESVNAANTESAKAFEQGLENEFEVMHSASSDTLAYWTGMQRSRVRFKGSDEEVPMRLRITEIFRKEADGWKLIHRHADPNADAPEKR